MSTSIAIMQPTYLPWIGYFDLMDQVDCFILLDDVQFVKQSWHHRNRIKTPKGLEWLTVPVKSKGRFGQKIIDVEIREPQFAKTHENNIERYYSHAACYSSYSTALQELYKQISGFSHLGDVNLLMIRFLSESFGIVTPIYRSSDTPSIVTRTHRLAEICRYYGAQTYISPMGAFQYLLQEKEVLQTHGVKLMFHNYTHPIYHQCYLPFLAHAAGIDLLFNEGTKSLEILRSGRSEPIPAEIVEMNVNGYEMESGSGNSIT